MPITSTEISSIIQSQIGMFSASAAYSQAISAQYGYQGMGGQAVTDPRQSDALQAGGIASGLARAPGMGMGALSMASMFGMGPAFMDPFSMTFRMGAAGAQSGGMAGALGQGAATWGAYAGAGAMGNWATGHMMTGAQNRGMLNATMGGFFPQASANQLGQMSGMVEQTAQQGMGGIRELTGLMQAGAGSGQLDMSSLGDFTMSFQRLVSKVRQVATTLKSSLQDAHAAMLTVKGMGVGMEDAAGYTGWMRAVGKGVGLSPGQMSGVGMAGSELAHAAGIPRVVGATGAMMTAGTYRLAADSGFIERGSQGRYTQGAMRFLGSRRGGVVTGAMMDPSGEYDPEAATQIARGSMSLMDMRRRSGLVSRDLRTSRGGEMATRFISQFGPEGVAEPLKAVAGGTSMPESMMQSLTGLNRPDIAALSNLANQSQALRARVLQEAQAGFQEGARSQTLSQAVEQTFGRITKPIREKFQQFGASLTQSVNEALEDVTNQFTRGGTGAGPGPNQAFFAKMGMPPGAVPPPASPGGGFQQSQGGGGFMGGLIAGTVPMGLRIGSYPEGTPMGQLPAMGLGLERYSPGLSMFSASTFGGGPGGKNLIGTLGMGMDRAGAAGMRMFNAPQSGFMGFGGMGPVSGSARLAATTMRGAGLLTRGIGAATRGLSMPIMGYDMAVNAIPEMRRQAGLAEMPGGIRGDESKLLQFLGQSGSLGTGLERHTLGTEGLDEEAARALQLTPVAGTFNAGDIAGAGFTGAGSQLFATEKQLGVANQYLDESHSIGDIHNKLLKGGTNTSSLKVELGKIRKAAGGDPTKAVDLVLSKYPELDRKEATRLVMAPNQVSAAKGGSTSVSGLDYHATRRAIAAGPTYDEVSGKLADQAIGHMLMWAKGEGKGAGPPGFAKGDFAKLIIDLSSMTKNYSIAGDQAVSDAIDAAQPATMISPQTGTNVPMGYAAGTDPDQAQTNVAGVTAAVFAELNSAGAGGGSKRAMASLGQYLSEGRPMSDATSNTTITQAVSDALKKLNIKGISPEAVLGEFFGGGLSNISRIGKQATSVGPGGLATKNVSQQGPFAAISREQIQAVTDDRALRQERMMGTAGRDITIAQGAISRLPGMDWKSPGARSEGFEAVWDPQDIADREGQDEGWYYQGESNAKESLDLWQKNLKGMLNAGLIDDNQFTISMETLSSAGERGQAVAQVGMRQMRLHELAERSGMDPQRWGEGEGGEGDIRRRAGKGRKGRGDFAKWFRGLTGSENVRSMWSKAALGREEEQILKKGTSSQNTQLTEMLDANFHATATALLQSHDPTGQFTKGDIQGLSSMMAEAVTQGAGSAAHQKLEQKIATMKTTANPRTGGGNAEKDGAYLQGLVNELGKALKGAKDKLLEFNKQ